MKNYVMGIALLGFVYGAVACTNNTNKTVENTTTEQKEVAQTANPKFADAKVNEVYQHYIHLKTALVNDDAKEADMGAKMLEKALTDAGMNKEAKLATQLVKANDVKSKRTQLSALSLALADAFKKSKLASGVIYKQYCPMANDGKGGYWLASESQIKNPYYGGSMLKCGSVDEEIK
ncbi:DUF3347 domain-containing protein [Pelobium sp.]|nr:DUF3347 domain-containing protein [Pelobium sp.]MDA9554928.1 DUF3347 domain-containing protein [Pelobium sp.]